MLHLIFTFLVLLKDELVPIRFTSTQTVYYEPILVLRWVSVRFRYVASLHSVWQSHYSDLSLIVPRRSQGIIGTNYIDILLDDAHLRKWLQQRLWWKFSDPRTFFAITDRESSLVDNGRCVILKNFDESLPIAITKLRAFTHLTYLNMSAPDLDHIHCRIDLSAIAYSCPLLEDFGLSDVTNFCGSLAPLQKAQNILIHACEAHQNGGNYLLSSFIPSGSLHALKSLAIRNSRMSELFDESGANPLDSFVMLTDLQLEGFGSDLFHLVAGANITLLSLKITRLGDDHEDDCSAALLRMLSANSLKRVRHLEINSNLSEPLHWSLPDDECLVESFCIDLVIPKAVLFHFARIPKLKTLHGSIDLREFGHIENTGDEVLDEAIMVLQSAVESLFENGSRDHRIHVSKIGNLEVYFK